MRPDLEYEQVQQLFRQGLNDCAISRATGIPRTTIRDWRCSQGRRKRWASDCPRCDGLPIPPSAYAYLLGLYLGDGCISRQPNGTFRLRIVLDLRYPRVIDECASAMKVMRIGRKMAVGRIRGVGCMEVAAYWKHWPCLFPQHGSGPKHLRPISLAEWQERIVRRYPDRLVRGLIHSDGSRDRNRVLGKSYPRYLFSNVSADIRSLFCRACDDVGVRWTAPKWNTVSVARRPDVAALDRVVGPKR